MVFLKDTILNKLQSNPVAQQMLQFGNNIGNLFPNEEALCMASAFMQDKQTRIVVKKNRYEAQQLYQRLKPLINDTLLFVMEESLRVQAIASSPEDKQEQLYVLTQLVKEDKPRIIICNTAAFLRYLPDKELFKSLCFKFEVDQEITMAELKQKLNRAGYTKVNYVDRPCTYASRGGIVDVYCLEYEHPIRIEFFDTVIESIRLFHEETQRTIQTIDSVLINPATDLLFTDDQIEYLQKEIDSELEKQQAKLIQDDYDFLLDYIEKDKISIENYDIDPHLYIYFSYLNANKLTDYVNGHIIFSSQEEVENGYKKLNEETISFIQEMVESHQYLPKYGMFHDIFTFEKEHTIQMFHDFLDFKHPIFSKIETLEKSDQPLIQILENLKGENIYISLDDEHTKKVQEALKAYSIHRNITFIEDDFYEGFTYEDISVYTQQELFHHPSQIKRYQKTFKQGQILQNILELEPNDYVVHEQYGIGQYVGITTRKIKGKTLDYLHVLYNGGDELFVPLSQFQLVRKYVSKEGVGIKLSQLGSNRWKKTKEKVSKKVEEIASRLVELYAKRNEDIGFAFSKDDDLQREFEEAFEYEATPDQMKATEEIKREMEKPKPMDHLLCGDVGFGKTEVAMRAAFKAISNNKQVALLCPTTILSMQHYQTFIKRFENVGANIRVVNRFVPTKEMSQIKKELADGQVDIIIGTHKLLNKSFQYKSLGLLIIDEEQRFGVEHKEKIKEMKNTIDVLSLSATPIPRTLQMSLIGVRTISQLNTPPLHRHPIQTYVMENKKSVVKEIIQRELSRGGQVFYLYNHVSNIYSVAKNIQNMFPDAKVAVAHGRMDKNDIEQTMIDFEQEKYQILVCTTIIETGLDIANANTMIIDDADRFGLSQLYQIRGRVGRREKIAYCYLLVQPQKELTEQAHKRLKAIKEFTSLGSGYKVAMRDLTIRGAGDMLGPQQAGFIDDVGLDLYLEMLASAIKEKQGKPIENKKNDKVAQVQLSGYIPKKFTDNDGDKLEIYQHIKKTESLTELIEYEKRVEDLFGHIPNEVKQLFEQKKLDFFVNREGVESLKETDDVVTITMSAEWSKNCDGVKLFGAINDISRKINLKLESGKIKIMISKRLKKHIELLMQVIDKLEGEF